MKKMILTLVTLTIMLTLLVGCGSNSGDNDSIFTESIRKAGD